MMWNRLRTLTSSLCLRRDGACDTAGAICTTDGRRLSNRLDLSVAGASPGQLTAWVARVPERHDGTSRFTFELHFSEETSLSYVALRDSAFPGDRGHGGERAASVPSVEPELAY